MCRFEYHVEAIECLRLWYLFTFILNFILSLLKVVQALLLEITATTLFENFSNIEVSICF